MPLAFFFKKKIQFLYKLEPSCLYVDPDALYTEFQVVVGSQDLAANHDVMQIVEVCLIIFQAKAKFIRLLLLVYSCIDPNQLCRRKRKLLFVMRLQVIYLFHCLKTGL